MCASACVCMYVYVCICVRLYVYVCICVYMCVYACVYIFHSPLSYFLITFLFPGYNSNPNPNPDPDPDPDPNPLISTVASLSVYPDHSREEMWGMANGRTYIAMVSADRLILAEVTTRHVFVLLFLTLIIIEKRWQLC